jgi:hypothetical protein
MIFVPAAKAFFAAQSPESMDEAPVRVLSLRHSEALALAADLIKQGKYEDARTVLLAKPYNVKELEIERLYLLAQIDTLEEKYDDAIAIYRLILDHNPNIANIRFRLAELYLRQKSWWRADYHYRLALADKQTPEPVQERIRRALSYIRQKKNWNLWFNFGIAPDNNVNNAGSGEQCVQTVFGVLCNTLDDPQKDVGYNLTLGGDYEFRLSDRWGLRNEFLAYQSLHEDTDYNDVYLSYAVGGRYLLNRGDVFFGPTVSKRYIANKSYNYSLGLRVAIGYDLTRRANAKLELNYTPTYYDDYADLLDGDVKSARTRLFYALDSSKYLILKSSYEYEDTKAAAYTNDRIGFGVGFGAELPWGFRVYAEPSIQYTNYKGARWTVKNYQFVQIKERDTIRKYSVSLSNNKISIWGFVPTLSYTYTDKSSNIAQREYDKSVVEVNISKGF